ncbi:hypothetical protein Tco_0222530 [Tanacetum coccineum]|uniref:Reverse transcriptase domain-containing protein n=1 Tax=Tanacetum coccineum TaxID=301880 RepID=A0ABQ4X5G0_9ASTR
MVVTTVITITAPTPVTTQNTGAGRDQKEQGQQSHRSSYQLRHPGECRLAAGLIAIKCVQAMTVSTNTVLKRLNVIPRSVIFGDIHAPEFIYHGSLPGKSMKIISALKARTLLSHGCEGFLATIHDTTSDVSSIHDQPIVSEFRRISEELPRIPPILAMLSIILDSFPAEPISKAPYRMAPIELKELKDQLQELLERGFIRPSVSPWGAPICLSQEKRRVA